MFYKCSGHISLFWRQIFNFHIFSNHLKQRPCQLGWILSIFHQILNYYPNSCDTNFLAARSRFIFIRTSYRSAVQVILILLFQWITFRVMRRFSNLVWCVIKTGYIINFASSFTHFSYNNFYDICHSNPLKLSFKRSNLKIILKINCLYLNIIDQVFIYVIAFW